MEDEIAEAREAEQASGGLDGELEMPGGGKGSHSHSASQDSSMSPGGEQRRKSVDSVGRAADGASYFDVTTYTANVTASEDNAMAEDQYDDSGAGVLASALKQEKQSSVTIAKIDSMKDI